jgi:hypothetical protein
MLAPWAPTTQNTGPRLEPLPAAASTERGSRWPVQAFRSALGERLWCSAWGPCLMRRGRQLQHQGVVGDVGMAQVAHRAGVRGVCALHFIRCSFVCHRVARHHGLLCLNRRHSGACRGHLRRHRHRSQAAQRQHEHGPTNQRCGGKPRQTNHGMKHKPIWLRAHGPRMVPSIPTIRCVCFCLEPP